MQAGKEGVQNPSLTLKYLAGDAAVEKAMKELCEQVHSAINVTLTPLAVLPAELRRDVETTYSYDLAYYHDHFPDDCLLGRPTARPARSKLYGIQRRSDPGDMGQEPSPRLPSVAREVCGILHDRFLNEQMPFIPLWQLDALSVVRSA